MAVSVFVIFFSVNSRFAEKGDEVKYVGGVDLGISTINKSELIIYRVEGYYDGDENDEDTYEKYDSPSYLVTDSKGNYFEFNNAYEGSGYARFIQSLSDDYSKEITTVKAIEDIKEIKR
ncbi:MAG: hypothetical protein IJ077_01890 [Eubacterium sp.]|nr:hypothetical protein [Eubacterium sp.]